MKFIFNTNQHYILEDDAVLLRPLQATDMAHLKCFAINEPTLWQYSLVPASGVHGMATYIDAALAQRAKGLAYAFIVFDKKIQQYAGCTRFYDIQLANNMLQLGYTWYGAAYQGTGLNKHCKLLMLQFAFEQIGMHRVEFRADINNGRSIAAMKSIGGTTEGILRENCTKADGTYRTSIVLSILKSEWQGGVKDRLIEKIYASNNL